MSRGNTISLDKRDHIVAEKNVGARVLDARPLWCLVIMISHTGIPIHGREVRGLITHDEEIETVPLDIHGGSTVVPNMLI